MFKINSYDEKIFHLQIKSPRDSNDENLFLGFLENVFEHERFGLILEVEGNGKSSPNEIKKSDIPIPKSTKNLIEEAEKTIQKEIPESFKEVKKDDEIVVEKKKNKNC